MMISDLPLDLESEILSRVPANSLSQLRSTCKRWYVLIKDPEFVKKNLGKAATQVILNKCREVYSGSINLHGIRNSFDPSFEFTGKLNSLKDSKRVEIYKIFHCDGLLLCTTDDYRIVVWNPCTGQIRWIKSSTLHHTCFLGYENRNRSCHSYKILRFGDLLDNQRNMVSKVEIYEFNSDSWRVLDGIIYNSYEFFHLSRGVSLKGNSYWFDGYKTYHPVSSLVMFDFTTERLGHIFLPFQTDNLFEAVKLSVVREEKLALLRFDIDSSEMKIWVTNTKTDEAKDLSWSYFLVVDFGKLMIQGGLTNSFSFLVDEENKMVVCCDADIDDKSASLRIYTVGENMHKEVYKETTKRSSPPYDRPLLLSYVPSLVHIDSSNLKQKQKGD